MGRPFKSGDGVYRETVTLYLSPAQKKYVEGTSALLGISKSDLMEKLFRKVMEKEEGNED